MDRFDRIYAIHQLMANRRTPLTRAEIQEKLGCSRATVTRTIADLRDFLRAPLVFDRKYNGYRYATDGEQPFELPGLWFNASELYALLATHQLLANIQPGLLEPYLAPLRQRIEDILEHKKLGSPEIAHRIRIIQQASRATDMDQFRPLASAVVQRKQLRILYHGRERDETTERVVSPQRLVYYRDNWYLDAWCHLRKALRSFSVDRLHVAETSAQPAEEISDAQLDTHYARAYGIFAGEPKHIAVLHFTAERSRWVADEQWHPQQESRVHPDGSFELRVPYSDPRELIMDILKYGPDVEVLEPDTLRRQVAERLAAAVKIYR